MMMKIPFVIFLSTAVLLAAGVAADLAWGQTGDPIWIRSFFSYPGAMFLVGCSLVGCWASFKCWTHFSAGDLLRPAWLLIGLSALSQLIGGIVAHVLGNHSLFNPLLLFGGARRDSLIRASAEYAPLFSPVYMVFLVLGLLYVLKACRQNGIVGRFRSIDIFLLLVVAAYTVNFFASVVFAPHQGEAKSSVQNIISWTSDPLLCILLFQAILIRRSIANMGWGLIARCWLSFTAAIFLTSLGDFGLWAWANGYLPRVLEIGSWYVWFLASAAYALGPCYQLQALLHATSRRRTDELVESSEPLHQAV